MIDLLRKPSPMLRSSQRAGVTLIELLIAVGIITLVAAVTLPAVRTIMSERKTSQAELLAKNYLEAARARAIARNKPVAVVIERLSSRAIRDPDDPSRLISVVASESDLEGNFSVYNTAIRLSMAEQPSPIPLDGIGIIQSVDSFGDPIEGRLEITSSDPRLGLIEEGAELEFPQIGGINRRFRVEQRISYTYNRMTSVGVAVVTVDNYGAPSSPYGTQNGAANFKLRLAKRKVLRPHMRLDGVLPIAATPGTRLVIYPTPKPTSVQVLDLPRGTCIDLSLSGMANDSPLVLRGASPVLASRRDTRRMFASNWSYTDPTNLPQPQDLRPVYLVFNGGGTLERIMTNDFGTSASNIDGNAELETYEALEDVFLFVGRTDQVIDAVSYANVNPEVLANESLKANLNDYSANWVRISPSSGAIAVAPVAAYGTGVIDDAVPIGQLLKQSRRFSFTDVKTAQ